MEKVTLVIGTRKGLFLAHRTLDGASPWELEGPRLLMQSIHCLAVDARPSTPRILVGTSHGHWGPGLFRSDDLGATWQESPKAAVAFPADTGASLVRLWDIRPAGPDRPGLVYAGAQPAALFRSEDGGESFHLVRELWDHPQRQALIDWIPEAGALYTHTVLTHPDDSDRLTIGIAAGGVYRSDDGGRTWNPSNEGIESTSLPVRYPVYGQCVHKIARVPTAPEQLMLQNHFGVYRSDDEGATWSPAGEGLPADFGFTVVAHPRRPGTFYVYPLVADTERISPDARCRPYRTRDAGLTWEALVKGLPQQHFYPSVLREALSTDDGDPAGVYLGTRGGQVYASLDDGDSWETVAEHLPDVLTLRALRH
ncbi:WD40/YVTN/BNR-like repeat-containing protein [Nocardiopsis sp. NPDC101807]|uniref:WD40/YVTN/BNR-like repeat-containing protein n=1 Tax=Nocardiopsis sp. NPDC101807 TaxID=3364339 RepID=UPI00382A2431